MDISSSGTSSLQSSQWQSLLDVLDPSSAAGGSDSPANLLISAPSAASTQAGVSSGSGTSGLAMLQALQSIGTTTDDPLLDATDGSSDSDPLLAALNGIDATSSGDPLLDMFHETDASSNALAMLQELNPSGGGSGLTQSGSTASSIDSNSSGFAASADFAALQAFFGDSTTGASNSVLIQALQSGGSDNSALLNAAVNQMQMSNLTDLLA